VDATVDLDGLLHAILTCVTAGPGLGFNRAVLFLADEDECELTAVMAVGPATPAEAQETWARLAEQRASIEELLRGGSHAEPPDGLQALIDQLSIPLKPGPNVNYASPLLTAYRTRQVVTVTPAGGLDQLPRPLREVFCDSALICVPLVAQDRSVGVIIADNAFSREPIDERRIQLMQFLGLVAGLALDNARAYRQVERQAEHLQSALHTLRATQEQLVHNERLATVGAVVARVSHEIRNPLTTIGGFARAIHAHPDDIERIARNAGIIVEEVEKLEDLLKEMLDFTSPRPPTLGLVSINPVLTALASIYSEQLSERRVQLEMCLAPDLPPVLADRNQIQRTFLNLWQNALQAMEGYPLEDQRTLTVRTRSSGERVVIEFSDAGVGIAPEAMPHIFTPFFTTKPRGTGLGLAVVKKIVDDHQGSIDVRSERGVGTTFAIELPIAR
jgi:signal transduction histidine kinase